MLTELPNKLFSTITVAHKIGDKVYILDLDRPARVKSIHITERGTTYQVVYYYDGKRYDEYLYEEELTPDGGAS